MVVALANAVATELQGGAGTMPPATLDSSLAHELALDSLARVELGARLEREFDVALNEQQLFDAETPRDLLRGIMKATAGAPLTLRAAAIAAAPTGDADIPHAAQTLVEMLEFHVTTHPERPHIRLYDDYTDGAVLTYADLFERASRVAANLQRHGLLPGERVALMLPTDADYFPSFYGTILAGGVPVPIYPPVRRQQLEDHLRRQSRILDNSGAALLITNTAALNVARLLTATVSTLRHVLDADLLVHSGAPDYERVQPRADDTAFLQYTSGSTGDPKGVVLSHANLLANVRADGVGMGVTSDDVFVSWLPLYHDMGLIGAWLGSLYHAVSFVVMPPLAFLARPERWLWAIHRFGGTLSAAPNFAFELCVRRIDDKAIEGLDLSSWRIAANGAEAISAATMNAFCDRFRAYGFERKAMFPVYGLAECAVGLAFSPLDRGPLVDRVDRTALSTHGVARTLAADDPAEALELVACGQPLPRHEIRVVDGVGRELPERHEGQVQFRGPSATSGYFARPDATAALIVDGWLDTGDRGYLAAGDLFVTGRSKDIIIRAGRNLYPPELEDAIGNLEGVRKGHVAVFGVPDTEAATERVVVLAETRRRDDATQARLREQINALATDLFAGPADDIVFAPPNSVLRTSSGKIRRRACRERYLGGHVGEISRPPWQQVVLLALAAVGPQLRRGARALGAQLHAVRAWLVLGLLGAVAWLLTWTPLPRHTLWRTVRALATLAAGSAALPIAVHGAEHLPAAGQPAIVVANHQSYLDGVLMLIALPRPPRFVVKGELGASMLLARPLRRLGALFVDRFDAAAGMSDLAALSAAAEAGALLVIFPEGTFKRMPGVLPFHLGAFKLAAASGAPLLPAAIRGSRSILRADSWFPRRGAVVITIREALRGAAGDSEWASAIRLRDRARAAIVSDAGEPDIAHESNAVE